MRLLLTAVRCQKGDLAGNLARHRDLLHHGRAAGCDLVLLPEMSLTGSGPENAVALHDDHVAELVRETVAGPALCFGLVEAAAGHPDPRPTITQVVARSGRVVHVHRKVGVAPDERAGYRAGDRSRSFDLGGGVSASVAVCAEIGDAGAYAGGSAVVLGPAAPGLYGPRRDTDEAWRRGFDWWRGSVLADAARLLSPTSLLAVSTQCGATTDEDFPGWCALVAPGGRVLAELPNWHEGALVVEIPQ